MARATEIDRLIEDGLDRYGAGDLDGALLAWEQALSIDPDNAQANSYVDYVRMNYEVLQGDPGPGVIYGDAGMPFGIEEEPEYVIEIVAGESPFDDEHADDAPPMYMDPLDESWFIGEEATRDLTAKDKRASSDDLEAARTISTDLPPQTLEIEADEPPFEQPPEPPPQPPRTATAEVSFESSTREYGSDASEAEGRAFRDRPMPATDFTGDTNADTNADARPRPPTNEFIHDASSSLAEATPGFGHIETEIKKRDLGFVQPTQAPDGFGVRLRTPAADEVPHEPAPAVPPSPSDDLIDSLPSPRPPPQDERGKSSEPARPPTRPPFDAIAMSAASTRDLNEINERLARAVQHDDPIVTAPTRELGLRPGRPASVYPDEDAPTRQSDARAFRADAAARQSGPGFADDGTNQDIVLPFDPIDATTAQILDEIDAGGSIDEPKDERTRRRIAALLDHAMAWNTQMELDKAVVAVDLALSEDPSSALAQKLIHRNRDTIMTVFQNYVGDLERQPVLARPLHELASAPISPRAAFLLSRIDGTLTIDEILDVSGMPRLEAYRHLCQLFLRGILR